MASGEDSAVSGGQQNTASGFAASVSAGFKNIASGGLSLVSGGRNRNAPGEFNWAAGSLFADEWVPSCSGFPNWPTYLQLTKRVT